MVDIDSDNDEKAQTKNEGFDFDPYDKLWVEEARPAFLQETKTSIGIDIYPNPAKKEIRVTLDD